MKIELSEYDPSWHDLFSNEKDRLQNILPAISLIEHIGSTSVKGLCAKPIIDILCGLESFSFADKMVDPIVDLGYAYIEKYNLIIPDRRFFKKYSGNKFHIHLVQTGTHIWKRHILFRDFLRANEKLKNEYSALKRELATRDWEDMNEYASAKSDFIKSIENKAINHID